MCLLPAAWVCPLSVFVSALFSCSLLCILLVHPPSSLTVSEVCSLLSDLAPAVFPSTFSCFSSSRSQPSKLFAATLWGTDVIAAQTGGLIIKLSLTEQLLIAKHCFHLYEAQFQHQPAEGPQDMETESHRKPELVTSCFMLQTQVSFHTKAAISQIETM